MDLFRSIRPNTEKMSAIIRPAEQSETPVSTDKQRIAPPWCSSELTIHTSAFANTAKSLRRGSNGIAAVGYGDLSDALP